MRIEPDGIIRFVPRIQFCCDWICVSDVDPAILSKWICKK